MQSRKSKAIVLLVLIFVILGAAYVARARPIGLKKAFLDTLGLRSEGTILEIPLYIESAAAAPEPKTALEGWCSFKTFGLPGGAVLINEIAWMGSEEDSNAEWIELKNVSGGEIDLKDWQILSKDRKIKVRLKSKTLQAGDFYVLARQNLSVGGEDSEVLPDQTYEGSLSNSGAWLKLLNTHCNLADEVNAKDKWPAGSQSSKKTMERKVASEGWQTSDVIGGSPRAQNFIPSAPLNNFSAARESQNENFIPDFAEATTSPRILISAIQITGVATDDDRITLYNSGPDSVDITGFKLRKRTKSGAESSIKVLAGEIPGLGYYVWANSKHPEGADATSTQTLSADNSAALLNSNDALMDAVAWGGGHVDPFAEGNSFLENPVAGKVLTRRSSGNDLIDTNNNADDFEIK